jgi:hypothetical protein
VRGVDFILTRSVSEGLWLKNATNPSLTLRVVNAHEINIPHVLLTNAEASSVRLVTSDTSKVLLLAARLLLYDSAGHEGECSPHSIREDPKCCNERVAG